jgi:hypothetical protein
MALISVNSSRININLHDVRTRPSATECRDVWFPVLNDRFTEGRQLIVASCCEKLSWTGLDEMISWNCCMWSTWAHDSRICLWQFSTIVGPSKQVPCETCLMCWPLSSSNTRHTLSLQYWDVGRQENLLKTLSISFSRFLRRSAVSRFKSVVVAMISCTEFVVHRLRITSQNPERTPKSIHRI